MDTKEIVALTEKWLEQIKQITVEYKNGIDRLEKARQDYENQKKKWYRVVLPYFLPVITIIVLIFAFVIAVRLVGCPNPIHITFQDLELTQACK